MHITENQRRVSLMLKRPEQHQIENQYPMINISIKWQNWTLPVSDQRRSAATKAIIAWQSREIFQRLRRSSNNELYSHHS